LTPTDTLGEALNVGRVSRNEYAPAAVARYDASVALFMASSGFGGAELHTASLASALRAQGIQLYVFQGRSWPSDKGQTPDRPIIRHELQWQTNADNLSNHKRIAETTANLLEGARPDVVLCASGWPDHNLPFIEAAVAVKRPVMAIFHLAPADFQLLPWQKLLLAQQSGTDVCLVAVSDHVAKSICRAAAIDVRRFVVIPNRAQRPNFHSDYGVVAARSRLGLPIGETIILSVGRMVREKGWRDFLSIAQQVVHRQPDVRFIWVGEGPDFDEFKQATRECGLTGRVQARGWSNDIASWYAAADLFISTSYAEGDPLVVREASAFGLPVIASAGENLVASYPSFILRSPVGITSSFSQMVCQILEKPENLRRLRVAALEYHTPADGQAMHVEYLRRVRSLAARRVLSSRVGALT